MGGKTGVNHPLGKNMIGAFYQPRCVLIDTDSLNTLPDRELASGISGARRRPWPWQPGLQVVLLSLDVVIVWHAGRLCVWLASSASCSWHALRAAYASTEARLPACTQQAQRTCW